MEKIKSLEAVKLFFEKKDAISPNGGKPLPNAELMEFAKANPPGTLRALGQECASAMGFILAE